MMKLKNIIFLFCFLFVGNIFAQTDVQKNAPEIKVLKQELSRANTDSEKIRVSTEISSLYRDVVEIDSSKKYASLALNLLQNQPPKIFKNNLKLKKNLAKAMENYGSSLAFDDALKATDTLQVSLRLWKEIGDKSGIAMAYYSLGVANSFKSSQLIAIDYFNQGLRLFEETKNKKFIGNSLLNISLEKRYLGMYGDALEYSIKSLKVAEEIKDTALITNCLLSNGFNYMLAKNFPQAIIEQRRALQLFQLTKDQSGIATSYNDMGTTELNAGNLENALKYNKTALAIRKKVNNVNEITISYNYISKIYRMQGKLEEALATAKLAIPYALKFGDSRFVMDSYLEIGDTYRDLKDYKNAIVNYDLAYKVGKKNNSKEYQATALVQIAKTYMSAGNKAEALSNLKKAEEIAQSNSFKNRRTIYQTMAEIYRMNEDYKNAYVNQVKFQQMNDTLNVIEKAEKITSLTQKLIYDNKNALQKASQDKEIALKESQISQQKLLRNISIAGLLLGIVLAIVFFIRLRENRKLNVALEQSLVDLKSTQKQLIQSEKMASLGELTAGIAHEIQNPLNFVNNFSEISSELVDEMTSELDKGDPEEAKLIASDIKQNLEKISHHGKRADAIVKGMLQHSRSSNGVKESTDLNAICDEYLRLSYHGLRAKDKAFNAKLVTDFDESIGKIDLIPQDFGRVILNLVTNAFYAVNKRKKLQTPGYEPTVSVSTKKAQDKIIITISDNGDGIPQEIRDKIFEPFFTTKPTGEGTGLGLSMSYEIITKIHKGELKVESRENVGTTFSIILKNI